MTWAAIQSDLNASVLRPFGEVVTITQGAVTTEVVAVITKMAGPWLNDGVVQISQHVWQGLVMISDLATEPVLGTTLTTEAGVVYVVDQPPAHDNGMYSLILKRRPA